MSEPKAIGQILAEMELLSHGSTARFDSGGHTKPGSRLLRADRDPDAYPHLQWGWRYANARDKEAVRHDAQEALERYKVTPSPGPTDPVMLKDRDHLAFKRMVLAEPGSVSEVARKFMVSRQSIYTWRRMYGNEEAA